MITDQIKNASLYSNVNPFMQKTFEYLTTTDFSAVEPGKYEIDGENVYALVSTYNTKPLSVGKWEAHKRYIDVQYIFSGKEKIGFTNFEKVIPLEEYNEEKDIAIYKGEGNFFIMDEKYFAIFFPTDVHMPGLAIHIPKEIKKIVVKVRVEKTEEKPNEVVEHENG